MTAPQHRSLVAKSLLGAAIRVIGLCIAGFIFGVILYDLFSLIVSPTPLSVDAEGVNITLLITSQGFGFIGAVLLFIYLSNYTWESLRLKFPDSNDLILCVTGFIVLLVTLGVVNILLVWVLGIEDVGQHSIVEDVEGDPQLITLLMILSLTVIGPSEELLFRGAIQTYFVDLSNTTAGIIIASSVFATIHIPAYIEGNVFASLPIVFILSAILGTLYEYSDNLTVPILVHGLYNASIFFLLL